MATAQEDLAYRFEVEDEIQLYRPRPAKRYMLCPAGGYYVKLELLPEGRLVAVFKGGDGVVGQWGHLQIATSTDGGESWTPPRAIVQMDLDTDHMALGQTRDGALVLCFIQPHAYQNGMWDTSQVHDGPVYMVRSTDGGLTWTQPVTIDTSMTPVPDGCNPHGKMAQLPDGTLLMSVYLSYRDSGAQASYQRHGQFGTVVLRSRDGGRTWGDASLLAEGFVEPSLYVLPSGRLIGLVVQFMPGRNLWQTESDDGGYTWSPPRPITGYHEYSGAGLLLLKDGRLLLAYGHRSFPGGVRAMISRDEGRSWDQECKVILSAESVYQFCGGGSSVQLADGKIVTAYFQHQGTGPFLHPRTYWVSAGFFSGPYAAVVKYDPADLP